MYSTHFDFICCHFSLGCPLLDAVSDRGDPREERKGGVDEEIDGSQSMLLILVSAQCMVVHPV